MDSRDDVRLSTVVAVIASGALVSAALDPRLSLAADWLHVQWVVLFAVPMAWLAVLAAVLDRRAERRR